MLRRLLYGRKIHECGCGQQFDTQAEYETHWRAKHELEEFDRGRSNSSPVAMAQQPDGTWRPAVPLPGFFRERKQADW